MNFHKARRFAMHIPAAERESLSNANGILDSFTAIYDNPRNINRISKFAAEEREQQLHIIGSSPLYWRGGDELKLENRNIIGSAEPK